MSSKSRNRTSSPKRRSRSPRRKKSLSPAPLRRRVPIRGKRPPSRGHHSDGRDSPKRLRSSLRNRRKTPPRHAPRSRRRSFSAGRDVPLEQQRSPQHFIGRDSASRLHSEDKYVIDRPLFRGPDKDVLMDRDNLKKIVVKMRDTPTRNDNIKRDIVNPEDINVVRRAGEGSRPIFDRDEIVNYGRKYEEGERDRKCMVSRSPVHSGHSSSERNRPRDTHYEERNASVKNYSRGRPTRDYDSHRFDRSRDERIRLRHQPSSRSRSSDGQRERPLERSERHDERDGHRFFRRTPERGRSNERSRRRPSPRRHVDDYRPERERRDEDSAHYRDRETVPVDDYSDYLHESHGYYEGEMRESPVLSPGRGRSHAFPLRRRGISLTRAFARPGEIIVHPAPPVRPVRGAFLPRVPGRRLPFPPRLVRPIVGPVIRVIAPVIPVRPPVLPVRPPPVIPVRHPVIPLPF